MKKGAIPIPYIVALIFGVIVISLIGYWLVNQGGKTITSGATTECDALCVAWKNSGFNLKPSGIDKCSDFGGTGGASVCAVKLGCDFGTDADEPCPTGHADYGRTSIVTDRKVCCRE